MRSLFFALFGRFFRRQEPKDPRHVPQTDRAIGLFKTEVERLSSLSEAGIRQELDENFNRQDELIRRDMRVSRPGTIVYGRSSHIIMPEGIYYLNPLTGAFYLIKTDASD